ncbi:MAG: hypothetical protein M0Z66_08925 [Thermaerobacter sp.]|nr:hypothetical protein [Thermaerobacter sp.]
MGWAELSLAAMFLATGVGRFQDRKAGGTLYVGVAAFLFIVVAIVLFGMSAHATH